MPFLVACERALERHFDRRGQPRLVRSVRVDRRVDRRAWLFTLAPYSYYCSFVTIFRKAILRRLEK